MSAQLPIIQHWFRRWLGVEQATSHFLNQCWASSMILICVTRPQCVYPSFSELFSVNIYKCIYVLYHSSMLRRSTLLWSLTLTFKVIWPFQLRIPGYLGCWRDNSSQIWVGNTKFASVMHLGILPVGIQNGFNMALVYWSRPAEWKVVKFNLSYCPNVRIRMSGKCIHLVGVCQYI